MVTSNYLSPFRALLPSTFVLFVGAAFAQAPADTDAPKPAPLTPLTTLTTLQYSSPIRTYQAYADPPVQSWREANDRVGQIGGWRTYAKEIKMSDPASDKNSPAGDPHSGHQGGDKP